MSLRVVVLAVVVSASGVAADPVSDTRAALKTAKIDAAAQQRARVIARADFMAQPAMLDMHLSPDGRMVSFLRVRNGGADVIIEDTRTGAHTRVAASVQNATIAWSGDGARLWLADQHGIAVIAGNDLKGKRVLRWDLRRAQRLWSVDARASRYAIIYEKVAGRHRYLRVDAVGKTNLLLDSALPLRNALLNENGTLAYVAAFDGPRYETVIRQYTSSGTRELLRCGSLEDCRLVGYNAKQQSVWLLAAHQGDKLALKRWTSATRRWEPVHRDPAGIADAGEPVWDARRETWLAIPYHRGRRSWYAHDDATLAVTTSLRKELPDANLQLAASADAGVWLVRAQQSDRVHDRYYVYHAGSKELRRVASASTPSSQSGTVMQPISYRARDGMLLHGYVLLPSGIAAQKAPLISYIHGGPITRVYDRFEPITQMLVNRGYAVFVPNFRASTGYGRAYVSAANGDVGNGRVLGDIIDGMDFLLAEGIGDRRRQAVAGMSFGGYASLLAVSHHPTRFRFAFAGTPPTDYGWIKQWQADQDARSTQREDPPLSLQFTHFGLRYTDAAWRAKMRRESPLASIAAMQAPVYIWAGGRDDRVPLKSIAHYVGEVRRLGKPITLLIDPEAGHVPHNLLSGEANLYLLERAAQRHLGGALQPASKELDAFMRRNLRVALER